MEDTFFSIIENQIKTYRTKAILIKEAAKLPDDKDTDKDTDTDTEKANEVVEAENQEAKANNIPDPTEMPEQGEGLPENDNGVIISDAKLTMYANLLLKAYMTPPSDNIPFDLLNVTEENADKVIGYIEKAVQIQKPQNELVNNLVKY